jgi:hypothetical protein
LQSTAERPLADRVHHLRLIAPFAPKVDTHIRAIERMVGRAESMLVDGRQAPVSRAA